MTLSLKTKVNMTFFSRNILNLRVLACLFLYTFQISNGLQIRGHNDLDVSKKYESSLGGYFGLQSYGGVRTFRVDFWTKNICANLGFN